MKSPWKTILDGLEMARLAKKPENASGLLNKGADSELRGI
jgi:hypothetical protein